MGQALSRWTLCQHNGLLIGLGGKKRKHWITHDAVQMRNELSVLDTTPLLEKPASRRFETIADLWFIPRRGIYAGHVEKISQSCVQKVDPA
jgi:hypothetical protein